MNISRTHNKGKCVEEELSPHERTYSHSPSDVTFKNKISSSSDTHNDHLIHIPYDNISYSVATVRRMESLDSITPPTSYIHDEKSEFYDQRLAILKQYITNKDSHNMDKLLVYISLEYMLNSNPKPDLLKNIYNALDAEETSTVDGHSVYNYLKQNKNELIEYIHLNAMNQDTQIQRYCEWKLNQIFSLYFAHDACQHHLQSTESQLQQLQHEHNKIKDELRLKEKQLMQIKQSTACVSIPIARTISQRSTNREWTVFGRTQSQSVSITPCVKRKHLSKTKSYNDIDQFVLFENERKRLKKKKSKRLRLRSKANVDTKHKNTPQQALFVWKQYTERLMYIKQRYPTEFIDRHKAWQKWSHLLNTIEETGRINDVSKNNIWRYIDFARMSLGRYANWIWYAKEVKCTKDRKWIKKYLVLMDFNLFLFDTKAEVQCLKQVLSFKHMVLSIASIRNVTSSSEVKAIGFILNVNNNKSVELRCEDRETKESCVDEFVYQMKCVRDLLKLPHIKLQSADPHGNISVPFAVGFDK